MAPPQATRPAGSLVWKAQPLFLSSTFRDLDLERDYLRNHAFRVLEERLRERAHYLDPIDLRQGVETANVAEQEARELKVLKVCLDEITRSRPFFVGLLGDRYGWVPAPERMAAAAQAAGFKGKVAGHSVTELEILHGVLENKDQCGRSWFYFREMDYTGMPAALRKRYDERAIIEDLATPPAERTAAIDRQKKLKDLKERIRKELPDRWRTYPVRWDAPEEGIRALDSLVVEDLWADLKAETEAFLREAPRTWQEADLRVLKDFVAERIRSFVERPEVTRHLLDHVLSPVTPDAPWGMVVTGEPGSGKSSLFGRVYQELLDRKEVLVLGNAAGISVGAGQVDRQLRRWISELSTFLGVDNPVPDDEQAASASREGLSASIAMPEKPLADRLDEAFAELLIQAAERTRVIVLLDALNQFESTTRARYVTWLPKAWPTNARLLATAIAGTESQELLKHAGTIPYALPPVERAEAADIARQFFLERYRREVNEPALQVLLEKKRSPDGRPAHSNPLWLSLALQEMNLLEADDFERAEREFASLSGAERIQALQVQEAGKLPADAPGVYGRLLERAERDSGPAFTRALVNFIALSRTGWRESDLREMLTVAVSGVAWEDLAFAGVRRALGSHLLQRGIESQWDFFHAQLREAVLARNLPDPGERRKLHGRIADHMEGLPAGDALRGTELIFHLAGLADHARAARYLGALEIESPERAAAASTLAGLIETDAVAGDGAPVGEWVCPILGVVESNLPERWRVANFLLFDLNDKLAISGSAEAERGRILNAVKAALEPAVAAGDATQAIARDLSVSYSKLGDLQLSLGDGAQALAYYQKALAIAEELRARNPQSAYYARDLSVSYSKLGDLQRSLGDGAQALAYYQKALAIAEELRARNPQSADYARDLAVSYERLGDLQRSLGDGAQALAYYQKSLALREELRARNPQSADYARDLAVSYERLGDLQRSLGDGAQALAYYQKSLALREELRARNPQSADYARDLSVSYSKLGDLQLSLGDGAQALAYYQKSLALREELRARNPQSADYARDLSVSYSKLGDLQRSLGDGAQALAYYQNDLAIAEELRARNPQSADYARDLAVSYERLGDLQLSLGDGAQALAYYQKSLALREELRARNPQSADYTRDLSVSYIKLGDLQRSLGDDAQALAYYQKALAIAEELRARNPQSAYYARDLSVSYSKLGDLQLSLGDGAQALAYYQKSLALREELRARNPQSADYARDLAVSYERLGDLQLSLGDGAQALAYYQKSLALREELRARNPQSADYARDLAVSHYKLAQHSNQAGDESAANRHLRTTHQILREMRTAGMLLDPPIAQLLEELDGKFSGPAFQQVIQGEPAATRRTDEAVATDARKALDGGDTKGAQAILYKQNSSNAALINLLAVCHLRLDESQLALDLLRPLIFPNDALSPSKAADPLWIINMATALLLRGDTKSARSALNWIKEPNHPAAVQLLDAIGSLEKSLTAYQRFKRLFGIGSLKPVSLIFPPGVY